MDGWIDRWMFRFLPVAKKREIYYCATNRNKVIEPVKISLKYKPQNLPELITGFDSQSSSK
jgi:hypothetical protein